VLQHPWILKKSNKIALVRRKSGDSNAEQFKAFTMTEEVLKASEEAKQSSLQN